MRSLQPSAAEEELGGLSGFPEAAMGRVGSVGWGGKVREGSATALRVTLFRSGFVGGLSMRTRTEGGLPGGGGQRRQDNFKMKKKKKGKRKREN